MTIYTSASTKTQMQNIQVHLTTAHSVFNPSITFQQITSQIQISPASVQYAGDNVCAASLAKKRYKDIYNSNVTNITSANSTIMWHNDAA